MKTLDQIHATLLREFWYERGEALVNQLCFLDDLITKVEVPFVERYLQKQRYRIGEKIQNADQNFWYYAARDGKP